MRFSKSNTGQDLNTVRFDFHPPATTVSLLPPPKLMIDVLSGNRNASWDALDHSDECLSVRFTCSQITDHRRLLRYSTG